MGALGGHLVGGGSLSSDTGNIWPLPGKRMRVEGFMSMSITVGFPLADGEGDDPRFM